MSENYGHLSRQLKECRDRMAVVITRGDASTLDFLAPEINRLERIVSALESIGVNLDETDIEALERIASGAATDPDRGMLRDSINEAIREDQEFWREHEQQSAIEALTAAGFVLNDEDGETWTRDNEMVQIELTNGRESRYKWGYAETESHKGLSLATGQPATMTRLIRGDSGVSGEFSRLISLIGKREVTNAE